VNKKGNIFLDNNAYFLWWVIALPLLLALAAANHFWNWQLGWKSFFIVIPISVLSVFLAESIARSAESQDESHNSGCNCWRH
jgi:membrane protein implicated in regulation of membrane protease activity